MLQYTNSRPLRIIGPAGHILTLESLPPPDTTRWVASRKAQVVAAVEAGLLTIEEVQRRYRLSLEEFYGWQHALERAGVAGLRVSARQNERTGRRRSGSAAKEHQRRLQPV
ncbi:MAG: hypothetical protein RL702_1910 [Pseudomonadota bacterium]|jgi:hypothetical protein|nr:DUF1153 domain-containing protein [Novosphingobium sp.]HPB22917.1 DUF1153 domain-containing protein [Novosphingobium sp.]HPZ47155.1 DUF1153 domain-containing protein [Novosphingobium sp.]HQE00547.1 DUF1153 domain-containing protein [Novosphingobium sp.]HQN55541.1 DUF1153 domain-containing protein [Novosphingobium sp.]